MPRFGPWPRCVTIGLGDSFSGDLITALADLRSRRRLLVQGFILGAFAGVSLSRHRHDGLGRHQCYRIARRRIDG
jgi:hypothetical protein